jgi:hypothetical protein
MPYKIDAKGRFLPFPGYTIISNVNVDTSNICHQLFEILSSDKEITANYSVLPLKSWHMTVINLFDKAFMDANGKTEKDYRGFFTGLSTAIQEASISPQIHYDNLRVKGVIQLFFSMDENTKSRIQVIAETYGCAHLIPKSPHVTLAYQYKPVENEQFQSIITKLSLLFQSHLQANPIGLQAAQLNYFSDMTDFRPYRFFTPPGAAEEPEPVEEDEKPQAKKK